MQHLRLLIASAPQPPFDVEHAAQVAEHHGIGAGSGNVVAFAFGNVRGDLAVLQRKRAAETAALLAFVHLAQFDARHLRQQCARLLFHAEFA